MNTNLRTARLQAEANDLKERLAHNGYKPGEPVDLDTMPPEHQAWQARLWYIGFALTHPELPENIPAGFELPPWVAL